MSKLHIALAATLVLGACATEDDVQVAIDNGVYDAETGETVMPTPPYAMSMTSTPWIPGGSTTLDVSGAPPGSSVKFFRGNGLGPGPCPPPLGGLCMDITGSVSFGSATANPMGMAVRTFTVPATVPTGLTVTAQAVVGGATPAQSNPVACEIGGACSGGGDCQDFESGTWPDGGWTGSGSISSDAWSGSFSLQDPAWDANTSWIVNVGDSMGAYVKGTGRHYIGFDSDSAGTKSFVFAPNTGDIRFQDNPGFGFTELTTLPLTLSGSDWYYMEVVVDSTAEATGTLWDSTGAVVGTVSENYGSGLGDGWTTLRTFSGGVFDDIGGSCP